MGGYAEMAKRGNEKGSNRSNVANTQEGDARLNRPGEKGKMQNKSLDPKVDAQFAAGKGGYRTIPFIIVNESFERTADVAAHANLWAYMTERYNYTLARASSLLFLWGGVSSFLPTLGAFISDTYLGRYNVIAVASVLSVLHMQHPKVDLTTVPSKSELKPELGVEGSRSGSSSQNQDQN
ncbi:hypothetical protein RJ641_026875 [Dillenia turbinata]|uniref:Uncharacterized protein n=1 Tax=Dillenia turbinata TaxID=194707 RepID=A0AAN8VV32_9MAGN